MKYRQIGLGTKLELELYKEDGEKIPAVFVSQFIGYDEKTDIMEIYAPIFQGMIYPVPHDTQMNIFFIKSKDTFLYKAKAIERIYQGSIALLYIKPVSEIEKVERRFFFRMKQQLEIQYRSFKILLPDKEMGGDFIFSETIDISGGGVCIIAEDELEEGTFVEAIIKLDQKIRFVGISVRSQPVIKKGKEGYETGIEFVRIENKDRERIISYIFRAQRELLKKGWIKDDQ